MPIISTPESFIARTHQNLISACNVIYQHFLGNLLQVPFSQVIKCPPIFGAIVLQLFGQMSPPIFEQMSSHFWSGHFGRISNLIISVENLKFKKLMTSFIKDPIKLTSSNFCSILKFISNLYDVIVLVNYLGLIKGYITLQVGVLCSECLTQPSNWSSRTIYSFHRHHHHHHPHPHHHHHYHHHYYQYYYFKF